MVISLPVDTGKLNTNCYCEVTKLCPTLWDPKTAAHQASLSLTNSWSLLKLMFFESMLPSNHLILCYPLLLLPSIFPNIRGFSNESVFASGGQNIGVSALVSVLPMNIQDCFHLGLIGWISLQIKGLSRVFYSTRIRKYQFLGAQPSHGPTLTSIHDY